MSSFFFFFFLLFKVQFGLLICMIASKKETTKNTCRAFLNLALGPLRSLQPQFSEQETVCRLPCKKTGRTRFRPRWRSVSASYTALAFIDLRWTSNICQHLQTAQLKLLFDTWMSLRHHNQRWLKRISKKEKEKKKLQARTDAPWRHVNAASARTRKLRHLRLICDN